MSCCTPCARDFTRIFVAARRRCEWATIWLPSMSLTDFAAQWFPMDAPNARSKETHAHILDYGSQYRCRESSCTHNHPRHFTSPIEIAGISKSSHLRLCTASSLSDCHLASRRPLESSSPTATTLTSHMLTKRCFCVLGMSIPVLDGSTDSRSMFGSCLKTPQLLELSGIGRREVL